MNTSTILTDYEQIQNLLVRYCFVTDRGTADEIAELFWEDAEVNFNGSVNAGAVAMKKGFQRWIEKYRNPVVDLRHLTHAPMIEIKGNMATAETYYDADAHSVRKGKLVQLRGIYRDRLEKRSGQWRFARRHIVILRSLLEYGEAAPSRLPETITNGG